MPVILHTGGGAAPLNYRVKAYASLDDLPAAGKENELAVITSAPIAFVYWQYDVPLTPASGDVWVRTNTLSTTPVNIAKKGATMLYPAGAVKQYADGAWVERDVRLYQSGAWVRLRLTLYDNGDSCTSISGGWRLLSTIGVLSLRDSDMILRAQSAGTLTYARTENVIDLTPFDTVRFVCMNTAYRASRICVIDNVGTVTAYTQMTASAISYETLSIDVSSLAGTYAIGFCSSHTENYTFVKEAWLQ